MYSNITTTFMIIQVLKNNFVLSKTWADVSAQYAFSVSGSAKKSRSDQSSINLGKFVAAELETKAAAKPDPNLASDLEVNLIADVSVECSNTVAITQLNKNGLPESFKRNRIEIRESLSQNGYGTNRWKSDHTSIATPSKFGMLISKNV